MAEMTTTVSTHHLRLPRVYAVSVDDYTIDTESIGVATNKSGAARVLRTALKRSVKSADVVWAPNRNGYFIRVP